MEKKKLDTYGSQGYGSELHAGLWDSKIADAVARMINRRSEVHVRHAFIRKAYMIVTLQQCLALALASTGFYYVKDDLRPGLLVQLVYLAAFGSVGTMCVLACSADVTRRSPYNYVLLLAFTLCEALWLAIICFYQAQEAILISIGITTFVATALTLFACQTSVDILGCWPYIFCGLLCFAAPSCIALVGHLTGWKHLLAFQKIRIVYACCGAFLNSMYIVYDSQRILGGQHSQLFTVDDYAMAAISLYTDIGQLLPSVFCRKRG